MGLRFQKRIGILPWLRMNLSKSGASASLGPRGADVNIGRDGVTINAGIPGTGFSYRSKLGGRGGGLGILAVVMGLGFWAFQHWNKIEKVITPTAPARPASAASQADIRYVHREGSVLRQTESPSGKGLKKESKGAQVILLASDGEWAKVRDGDLIGWMRMSVLGPEPPG
jgi:hypothetical protein